jgi:dihydrofolate synthase/folylpolyglutamate synthase
MQNYLSDLYKKLSGQMKLGRQRAELLMQELGYPQDAFLSIHVAGTNGKGTVTSVAAALLEACGFKTGRFTSPHLVRFNERICIDRQEIREDYIQHFLQENEALLETSEASFFEVSTALGFSYFRDEGVDVAVVETGLGGRLDATSVLTPEVSVITSIGYDHMAILGNTLAEIAYEKAGIIKEDRPVVTIPQAPEIMNVLKKQSRELHIVDPERMFSEIELRPGKMSFKINALGEKVSIPLCGRQLLNNIALAMKAVEIFLGRPLTLEEIQSGFHLLSWKGRFEILAREPDVIYDVAHNIDSVQALHQVVREVYPERKISIIMGLLEDKSPERILDEITLFSDTITICPVHSHRSMSRERLEELAHKYPGIQAATSITEAYKTTINNMNKESVLLIMGSHYIAEEVYKTSSCE